MQLKVYRSLNGRCPFNEWFQGLDHLTGLKITRAVTQMEQGNFSNSRSVGDGVMERRIHSDPGFRIYYGRVGHTVILLIGGGTRRTQKADIQRALANWREFKSR
jgi:putative addiction module killer protein